LCAIRELKQTASLNGELTDHRRRRRRADGEFRMLDDVRAPPLLIRGR
jgi:hypothetical protein